MEVGSDDKGAVGVCHLRSTYGLAIAHCYLLFPKLVLLISKEARQHRQNRNSF